MVNDIRSQISQQLGVKVDDVILVPKDTLTKTSSGKRRHRYFRQLYLSGELQALRLSGGEKRGSQQDQVKEMASNSK